MTLGEPRGVGGLAGTATGYAFVLHGFALRLFEGFVPWQLASVAWFPSNNI